MMWSTEINYGDGNGDGHGEGWSKIVKDGKRQWELGVKKAWNYHYLKAKTKNPSAKKKKLHRSQLQRSKRKETPKKAAKKSAAKKPAGRFCFCFQLRLELYISTFEYNITWKLLSFKSQKF